MTVAETKIDLKPSLNNLKKLNQIERISSEEAD